MVWPLGKKTTGSSIDGRGPGGGGGGGYRWAGAADLGTLCPC